jgi:hypothetical protein
MKAVANRPVVVVVVVDAVVVDSDARNPHQDFSLCPYLPPTSFSPLLDVMS